MPQKTPDSLKTPPKGDAPRDPNVTPDRLSRTDPPLSA